MTFLGIKFNPVNSTDVLLAIVLAAMVVTALAGISMSLGGLFPLSFLVAVYLSMVSSSLCASAGVTVASGTRQTIIVSVIATLSGLIGCGLVFLISALLTL